MKRLFKTIFAAALVLLTVTGCKNLNSQYLNSALASGIQALSITDEEVMQYVHQAVAQMDAEAKIAPATSPYTKRLNTLTKGLTSVDGIPLNFKVYQTNEINAFACADGSVRVYTGIMDLMNDDELLGIIGHEVGHVALKHSKNAMKNALMNTALRDVIASTSNTAAALTQSQLGQLGELYLNSKYSRKQENEADDFGYEFLKGAGRNPWAMVMAFEKMQTIEQQSAAANGGATMGTYLNNMFSDHPATQERIERMTKRAEKDGIARPTTKTTTKK